MATKMSSEGKQLLEDVRRILDGGPPARIWTPEQLMVLTTRKHLDLSQNEFARLLGVPVGTIRDWEQGRKQPDSAARTLIKVARDHPGILRKLSA